MAELEIQAVDLFQYIVSVVRTIQPFGGVLVGVSPDSSEDL